MYSRHGDHQRHDDSLFLSDRSYNKELSSFVCERGAIWPSVFSVVLLVSLSRFVGRKRRQLLYYACTPQRVQDMRGGYGIEKEPGMGHLRHIGVFSTPSHSTPSACRYQNYILVKYASRSPRRSLAPRKDATSLREGCRNAIPFMKPHEAFVVFVFPKKFPPSSRLFRAFLPDDVCTRRYVHTKPHVASILIEKVRLSRHRR